MNWQELEDLYSINESLYECRPDYSPSPDNWANFQKDVDKMFALRHILNNQTQKLDNSTLPELGSGAGGGGLEGGSGEELASTSDVWAGPVATPVPSRAPPAPPTPGKTPDPVANDLPESVDGRPVGSAPSGRDEVAVRSDARQLEEMEEDVFSGNRMTELETQHNGVMRTHTSLQAQSEPEQQGARARQGLGYRLDPDEEEDIFKAQGYIPFFPQNLRLKVQTRNPTQTIGVILNTPPQTSLPLSLDYEGSGSRPSNQTL